MERMSPEFPLENASGLIMVNVLLDIYVLFEGAKVDIIRAISKCLE
jgi:hypothetical protein